MLNGNESKTIPINFTPDRLGSFYAYLQINSASGNARISLTGRGIDPSSRKVYVINGGNAASDKAIIDLLAARGMSVTLGVQPHEWNGTHADLSRYDVVVLLNNYNWATGSISMPEAGQQALLECVAAGGGLITGEWLVWAIDDAKRHTDLDIIIPADYLGVVNGDSTKYTRITPNPIINKELPNLFTFSLNFITATESVLAPKSGATVFYNSSNSGRSGLIGWEHGLGRVISFSTLLSDIELSNSNYAKLFANTVEWASRKNKTSVSENEERTPVSYSLQQNIPNPFNPSTVINYQIPKAGGVELTIYNMLGQEVRKLVNESITAGTHSIQWDGNNNRGEQVRTGIYLYRMEAGKFIKERKMLLLR